ncbi:MAG: DUF4340 domain-containing protein [Lentisphaeraceae bacterium]|nr:DUF4340 domain-containing protein [Lentisphaeraceae bacterium]
MRKKQLITTFVLLVALVILSLLTRDKDTAGKMQVGDAVFTDVNPNDLTEIRLTRKAYKAETVLINDNGVWKVKNRYGVAADPALIRKYLGLVKDAKAVHVVNHTTEDLPLFQLDEKVGAVIAEFIHKDGKKARYFFGKSHFFSQKSSGRYLYVENKNSVILLDDALSYVSAQPSIWLKKYLPFHEEVASASLYSGTSIIWKTDRTHSQDPFRMAIPKASKKSPQEVKQLMMYVMQMRFMDITPAENDFEVDPKFKDLKLMFQTFDGKIYDLDFLALKGQVIRSRLKLVSSPTNTEFVSSVVNPELIKEELAEWHFLVPYAFFQIILK